MLLNPARPGANSTVASDPFLVMIVDDSAVIRGLLTRTLESDPDIQVVTTVANGQMALNALQRQKVDVIVLDIEMPVMDGLTALPKLIEADPGVKIVMASTLTAKNADISLRALAAGAADYVTKPSSTREIHSAELFKLELVGKVKALAQTRRQRGGQVPQRDAARPRPTASAPTVPSTSPLFPRRAAGPVVLREMPRYRPDIIAIGSSTGGPQALFKVLAHLGEGITQPIVITQHMPPTFTTILAEHITRQCGVQAAEAKDGEPLVGGRVYVAPGDFHMKIVQKATGPAVSLSSDPPENFCRPSVEPMLRSVIDLYGRRALAVILTGMGQDGQRACQALVDAGGAVVAQDEPTSVVWGMPGAVAMAGLCSAVLPIDEIGPFVRKVALRVAA